MVDFRDVVSLLLIAFLAAAGFSLGTWLAVRTLRKSGGKSELEARITELEELAEHQDRCIACREGEIEEEQKVVKRLSARIAELEDQNKTLAQLKQDLEDFRARWEGVIAQQAGRIAELERAARYVVECDYDIEDYKYWIPKLEAVLEPKP